MLGGLISALWTALELAALYLFCAAFLPVRSRGHRQIYAFLLLWILELIEVNFFPNSVARQFLTILLHFGFTMAFFKGKWNVHIFLVIIFYGFATFFDVLLVNGISLMLGIPYAEFTMRKLAYCLSITTDKLLLVLFGWLLYRFRSQNGLKNVRGKWLLLSLLFPALSAFMFIVLFGRFSADNDLSTEMVVYGLILLVSNIAMLYIINGIEKATNQEHEIGLLKQQVALQAENYNTLQKNYSAQRKATHEFERHLSVLSGLMEKQEYAEAQVYLDHLQNNRSLRIFSIRSNHPVVDTILNQKNQAAQEQDTKFHVQVNDLSSIHIQTDALVVLLSNLLDNALEACSQISARREINCRIIAEDSLYLAIRNTSAPVEIIDGEIATSKASPLEHGYGLPAVRYILSELGAEYTFEYSDGWFQFAAEIPL